MNPLRDFEQFCLFIEKHPETKAFWLKPESEKAIRQALSGWQDIASAPRDVKILLWVNNAYGHDFVKTGIVHDDKAFPYYNVVSVYDDGDALGHLPELYATHWQPLPAPPSEVEHG